MLETGMRNPDNGAAAAGLSGSGKVFWNLAGPTLYERAIARGEARLSAAGALVVETGATGEALTHHRVTDAPEPGDAPAGTAWLERESFERLKQHMLAHAAGRTLFAQDLTFATGSGRSRRLRVYTEHAWHAFALRNLMQAPAREEAERFEPEVTLFCLPQFRPDIERHGLEGPALHVEDAAAGFILVGGTLDPGHIERALVAHAGEALAGLGALALDGVASLDTEGGLALFLGPAGSGTSALAGALAADPRHAPLADGPLGWNRDGVFALFAGRRRQVQGLEAAEAGFGTLLENVPLDIDSREPDLAGASPAARALLGGTAPGTAGAPRALVLTSCDGFGVLPAIARLTPGQAVYHLLSGYTAPAGEDGAPRPRFAEVHRPAGEARLLRELIAGGATTCWLVNTGWSGGQAGRGRRVPRETTNMLVAAALDGTLAKGAFRSDPHFGFEVPAEVEGVEAKLLDPAQAWANARNHEIVARRLVGMFTDNFARFEAEVEPEVREAQPHVAIAAE